MYNKSQSLIYDKIHFNKDYEFEANFLRELISENKKFNTILDVGCGSGRHVQNLRSFGFSVTGVDPSSHMIDVAASNLESYDDLICGYASDVTGKYDVVISMFNVVNHILDELSLFLFFSEVISKLNDESLLIFDCFNYDAYINIPPKLVTKTFADNSVLSIVPEIDGDELTMMCKYDSYDVQVEYSILHKIWKKDYILDLLTDLSDVFVYKNFTKTIVSSVDYKMMVVDRNTI